MMIPRETVDKYEQLGKDVLDLQRQHAESLKTFPNNHGLRRYIDGQIQAKTAERNRLLIQIKSQTVPVPA